MTDEALWCHREQGSAQPLSRRTQDIGGELERTVAIVSPHFPPSNLAGVHRARLLGQHLPEFGWRPIIVTTHWRYYEEALDWGLASLVDPALEIIRTPAAPTRPVRLVGDIGIRALPWHLAALRRLRRDRRFDFLAHYGAVVLLRHPR